jgi:hypothetical protein
VVINKQKIEQNTEDRYTEIERENRLLFEKITSIHLKGMSGQTLLQNQNLNALVSTTNATISGVGAPHSSRKVGSLISSH